MKSWSQALLVLLICLGGIITLQLPRANEKRSDLTQEQALREEEEQKLRLDLINKSPNFGFDNLLANWVFLDFVQYYGDRVARDYTGNSLTGDYFETIINQDPRFVEAYFFLGPATSLFGGEPKRSVAITSRGLSKVSPTQPLAYQIWTYKGIDEMLFLGDNEAAKSSYDTAAKWANYHDDEAARIAAQRARETRDFLASNPDSRLVKASAWVMVYRNARDDQTRKLALEEIQKTGATLRVEGNTITVTMPEYQ